MILNVNQMQVIADAYLRQLREFNYVGAWIQPISIAQSLLAGHGPIKAISSGILGPTINTLIEAGFDVRDQLANINLKFIKTAPIIHCSSLINKMQSLSMPISSSVFLWGAPGTGKTFVVESLKAAFPKWYVYPLDLVEILDKTKKPTRSLDSADSRFSKQILILDEVDKVLNDSNIAFFLKEIDRARSTNKGKLLIIMTSNKPPNELPAPLTRPGRVSKIMEVVPWTKKEARDFAEMFEVPFKELTPLSKDGNSYLAGQCFEDVQRYLMENIVG